MTLDVRTQTRVALIGAGAIAPVHAEALRSLDGLKLVAVVDSHLARAEALARRFGAIAAFSSVADLLRAKLCDVAHVVVPPPAHFVVARELLEGGIDVFVEKPLTVSSSEARDLVAVVRNTGRRLGVNHNFVHHPAFVSLRKAVDSGRLGRLRSIDVVYNVPLRQLASRQFSHWMFHSPRNLLLEQAVHPLSQILSMTGPPVDFCALPLPPLQPAAGINLYDVWKISLRSAEIDASLSFAVGREFPDWIVRATFTDGVAVADILRNRFVVRRRHRWPDFLDSLLDSLGTAAQTTRGGVHNAMSYFGSITGLVRRSDPFFLSMRNSIRHFYAARQSQPQHLDGRFGADLVDLCERLGSFATPVAERPRKRTVPGAAPDIALIGGTGFIGTYVTRQLVAAGSSVCVSARNTVGLPEIFEDPLVVLDSGDVSRPEDVRRLVAGKRIVINLAQGAVGTSAEAIAASMVQAARNVALAGLEAKIDLLVHVSTIASLYLGDRRATVHGDAAADPHPERRAAYARGKAAAEAALLALQRENGLPLCILRPGIVVGEGASAFHSGLGFFNNDQHCMGWNDGCNPLPFVLAEDVAAAIVAVTRSPATRGHSYNLVGDVRLSAREYIQELARATGRPLRFHGQTPVKLAAIEGLKWLVKRAAGHREAERPTLYDLKSRGLLSVFDCSDAKRDFGWHPVSERAEFVRKAIDIHAPVPRGTSERQANGRG